MTIIQWATENPGYAFLLVILTVWAIERVVKAFARRPVIVERRDGRYVEVVVEDDYDDEEEDDDDIY